MDIVDGHLIYLCETSRTHIPFIYINVHCICFFFICKCKKKLFTIFSIFWICHESWTIQNMWIDGSVLFRMCWLIEMTPNLLKDSYQYNMPSFHAFAHRMQTYTECAGTVKSISVSMSQYPLLLKIWWMATFLKKL